MIKKGCQPPSYMRLLISRGRVLWSPIGPKLMRNSFFLGSFSPDKGAVQWRLSKLERSPRHATDFSRSGRCVVSGIMPSHRESVDDPLGASTELPPMARPAFLDRKCDDPELTRAVEELLAHMRMPAVFWRRRPTRLPQLEKDHNWAS